MAGQSGDFTYTDNGTSVTITGYTGTGGAVTIPATISSLPVVGIGASAFASNTNLTGVTIPASVTSIGTQAFQSCSYLINARFSGNAPTMGSNVFSSTASGFTVYYYDNRTGFTTPTWNGYPTVMLSGPPTVTTPTSGSITETAATLGGNVTSDGGAAISACGVVYALTSANSNPQIGGAGVTNVAGTGTTGIFTVNASGLAPGASYTFAAYATSVAGTGYSVTSSFTTGTAGTTYTWTSTSVGNWSAAGNWDANGVPLSDVANSNVTFNGPDTNLNMRSTIDAAWNGSGSGSVNSLSFNSNTSNTNNYMFTVGGAASTNLTVGAGGLSNPSGHRVTLLTATTQTLTLGASQIWNIANNWDNNNTDQSIVSINGNLASASGIVLTKNGAGQINFRQGNSTNFLGSVMVNTGNIYFTNNTQYSRLGGNTLAINATDPIYNINLVFAMDSNTAIDTSYFSTPVSITASNNRLFAMTMGSNYNYGQYLHFTGSWSGVIPPPGPNGNTALMPNLGFQASDSRFRYYFDADNSGLTTTATGNNYATYIRQGYVVLNHVNAHGIRNSMPIGVGQRNSGNAASHSGLLATSDNNVTGKVIILSDDLFANAKNQIAEIGIDGTGSVNFTGPVVLSSTGYAPQTPTLRLTAPTGGTVTITGNIVDSGTNNYYAPIQVFGTGNVVMSGTNTYKGSTSIRNGTLLIGSNSALGSATSTVSLGDTVTQTADVVAATVIAPANVISFTEGVYLLSAAMTTLDGVSLASGNRILIKEDTFNPERAGIYTLSSDLKTLTRATDLNTESQFVMGFRIHVTGGTVNGGKNFYLASSQLTMGGSVSTVGTFTLNSTDLGKIGFSEDAASDADMAMLTNGSFIVARNIDVTSNLSTGNSILGGNTADYSTFTGAVTLARALTVTAASGGMVDFSGDISGGFGVTKTGPGQVIFSSAKSYAGPTAITEGTLVVNNTLASSSITVNAAANLQGCGTLNAAVSVAAGGIISAASAETGCLSLSQLNFTGVGTVNVTPGVTYVNVTATSGLNPTGGAGSVTLNLTTPPQTPGIYHLIAYHGAVQGSGFSAFTLGTAAPAGLFYVLADNAATGYVDLMVTSSANVPFTYTTHNNKITITGYTGPAGAVSIPSLINGLPVTSIGAFAFNSNSLTSVTIPAGVTSIGYGAFAICTGLTDITVETANPNYSSGSGVLFDKSQTLLIRYPAGKAGAYSIPDGVTSIGNQAFSYSSKLPFVTIPASVNNIGYGVFSDCSGIASASFLGDAPTMENGVFDATASGFTVYYLIGKTGFTSPTWMGYPAVGLNSFIPPTITSGTVNGITASSATLDCTVNPNGMVSTAQYLYGRTTGYGSTASVTLSPNNGSAPQTVIANLTGLAAMTTYHYCLTATNGAGATPGGDMTFTTTQPAAYFTYTSSGTAITITGYTGPAGAVSIPSTIAGLPVTVIGSHSFDYSDITSVTIPAGVTIIGVSAFAYCDNLTTATIPAGVTSIGASAFAYCGNLATVTIPAGVTSIGDMAFAYCDKLTQITLPSSLTILENRAFLQCATLRGVYFLGKAPTLGGGEVFSGYNIMSICHLAGATGWPVVPAKFGGQPTAYWSQSVPDIFYTITGNMITIKGYSGTGAALDIPAAIDGNAVTGIGDNAFIGSGGLMSVSIPASVTSIGNTLFTDCAKLTTISVDASSPSYSSLDGVLFNKLKTMLIQCPAAKGGSYAIPGSVISIGNSAFYNCIGLSSVTIPPSVSSIGNSSFYNCTGLTGVTIPGSVTNLGYSAFYNCSRLTSVTISPGVTSIGYSAFRNCSGLTSVTVPGSVTSIGDSAFYNCIGLTSVAISPGVTSIGSSVFYNCYGLTSVAVPASVASIGTDVFAGCSGLTAIAVDSANPNYVGVEGVLFNRLQTQLIQYPAAKEGTLMIAAGVTNIESMALSSCAGLDTIVVDSANPNFSSVDGVLFNKLKTQLIQYPAGKAGTYTILPGVTSISDYAFHGCVGLTSVTFPASVTSLGYGNPFASCSVLTSVIFMGNAPDYMWSAFYPAGKGFALYCFSGMTGFYSMSYPIVTLVDNGTSLTIDEYDYSSFGQEMFVIPETLIGKPVTRLESASFSYCNLAGVTIPASVTSIGSAAFSEIYNFTSATFLGDAPSMGVDAFPASPEFTVYYHIGKAGFTSPTWQGYRSVAIGPPSIITQPQSVRTNIGTTATLSVFATGPGPLTYQWSKDGMDLADGGTVFGATTDQLTLTNVQSADDADYTVVVTNDFGSATSEVATLTTEVPQNSIPVTTGLASDITPVAALLHATVVPPGGATVAFEYGLTTAYGYVTQDQEVSGTGPVQVEAAVDALASATIYHYRAVAMSGASKGYGQDMTFTTTGAPPVAATGNPLALTATGATLVGTVNPNGLDARVQFEYGQTELYDSSTPVRILAAGDRCVDVLEPVTGLEANRTYYFRMVATTLAGTSYGEPVRFVAKDGGTDTGTGHPTAAPEVVTQGVVNVTDTAADLLGSVNPNGGTTIAQFEYGTTTAYGLVSALQGVGNGVDPVAFSVSVRGLQPGTPYHYRLTASNSIGGAPGADAVFTTLCSKPVVVTGAADAISTTSARVAGTVRASNADTGVFIDYGTERDKLDQSIKTTPESIAGDTATAVSAQLKELTQGATYYYQVRAENSGGAGLGSIESFVVGVVSALEQVFPDNITVDEHQGAVRVDLTPSGTGGWRFAGERQWRTSGSTASGLANGYRVIEFRPVPGYVQAPNEPLLVMSNATPLVLTRAYTVSPGGGSGGLSVTLKPEDDSGQMVLHGQWRLSGEDDTQWKDSGVTLTDLVPGDYAIECKPVDGRTTPPPVTAKVAAGTPTITTITYYLAGDLVGTPPGPLSFEVVSTGQQLPYAYCGQITSDAGSSSGFVVRPRVVATAGHVVFDDGTLAATTGLRWYFQRDRDVHEPAPRTPRGSYVLTGYAAQRAADNSPGTSTPASQTLDAAALFFSEDVGRGGFSGYLASDERVNEFVTSPALKTLVGYPMDGIALANQGKLHATPPSNVTFTPAFGRTYTTSDIRSSGGNSGGPLCLQHENGNYYPAAIYLGGTSQTVVRAIDGDVVALFGYAEVAAYVGMSGTGGRLTQSGTSAIGTPTLGAIKVLIEPAAARTAGAGWQIQALTDFKASGEQISNLDPNSYGVRFATVDGFMPPSTQPVVIQGGQLTTLTFTYEPIILAPVITSPAGVEGTRGQPLAYQTSATNVPGFYTQWGTLPAGMSFTSATGLIAGTPQEAGKFIITVGAANTGGSDTRVVELTVKPVLAAQSAPASPYQQAMSYHIASSESGAGVEYSASLPAGLALNAASGWITGTPAIPGVYQVPVTVTRLGASATAVLTLSITGTKPLITQQPVANKSVEYGTTTTLTVDSSGLPEPAFQWYEGASGVTTKPVAGATTSTFTTPTLTAKTTSYWARALSISGYADSKAAVISTVFSTNPNLASLTPGTGILSPPFNPGIFSYEMDVPFSAAAITFTPEVQVAQSKVKIKNAVVAAGAASAPQALAVGSNIIAIRVTAGDGKQARSYNVKVTRSLAPSVSTGAATNITDVTATLQGMVIPNNPASVYFQYGPSVAYGSVTSWQKVSGTEPLPVQLPLSGLAGNTIYHYRIVVMAGNEPVYGMDRTFTTSRERPLVATGTPSFLSPTEQMLIGAVNPKGLKTITCFQYGTTTDYGSVSPNQVIPAGSSVVNVMAKITDLNPGDTYHCRIIATSAAGLSEGQDVTFQAIDGNNDGIVDAVPTVTTGGVTDLTSNSAVLHGLVNPREGTTISFFEYGPTSTYGSATASSCSGNGNQAVPVVLTASNLTQGTPYHYRLVSSNSMGLVRGADATFVSGYEPPVVTTGPAEVLGASSVRLTGSVQARGARAEVWFDYGTEKGNLTNRIQAVPGTVTGDAATAVSVDISHLYEAVTYYYRIRAGSPGGNISGTVASFQLSSLIGLAQSFPREVPVGERQGQVRVNLRPSGVGGWRFVGEGQWRASGMVVSGMSTGDRDVEYQPLDGFIQPLRETVVVDGGKALVDLTRSYYRSEDAGAGTLKVMLEPAEIAGGEVPVAARAQWRLAATTSWHDSGEELGGLMAGSYLVECKAVSGKATPQCVNVSVTDGAAATACITYFPSIVPGPNPPAVVPFNTVSTSRNLPYAYVGQLRSGTESYSGFVVKPRVVATVAQAVFDEATLASSSNLQWLLQRDCDTYDPPPQVPRGIYTFDGYAAQRREEGTPGTLSNESQNLNVAAIYFVEDAGRGGFSGFLASDTGDDSCLQSSAMKMLVGYPVNDIQPANQGRLHATPPSAAAWVEAFGRTYTCLAIQGLGGMLGGPLCVQRDGGSYYPAGIYVGGTDKATVRAIDSGVIDLLTRAEISSNGGDNNTDGGISQTGYTSVGGTAPTGTLKVMIEPAAAVSAGGGWRLNPELSYHRSGDQKVGLAPHSYTVEFNPVSGFETPSPVTVLVVGNTQVTKTISYAAADPNNPIIWSTPKDITYGMALGTTQLGATARNKLPGVFVYDPPLGSILPAGSQILKVTFTPEDLTHNSIARKSVSLTVNKAVAKKVTIGSLAQTHNGQPRPVTVTTDPAGLNVNVSYNGSAAVPVNAGKYPVVATVTDDNYTGSSAVGQVLVIGKGTQTITFPPLPALLGTDADYSLQATASSGLPVSYACLPATTVATIVAGNSLATGAASKLHVLAGGDVTLTASQAGDSNWNAAPPVAIKLTISKRGQTMDFPAFFGHAVGDADFAPGATASSGLSIIYASDNTKVATIVNGMIHVVGPGTAGITASLADDARWTDVPPIKRSLVVTTGTQTITFPALPVMSYGDADFLLAATASSGLRVSYTSSNPAAATIVAGKIHINEVGTSTITAKQAGNASWAPAADVTRVLTVTKGTPAITWADPKAITYGTALSATECNAKASVPGMLAYDPALGVKLPAGVQTLNVTFTPNDTSHYNSTQKSVPLTVNKAAATLTLAGLNQSYNGQPRVVTVTTVPAPLVVNITYNGSPVAPTAIGSYTVVATVNDSNGTGIKTATLVIGKGTQAITFTPLPVMRVGDADYAPATTSSGLTVIYTSTASAVATIVGGKIHAVGPGTAIITASQPGNANWNAAPAIKQTLTVKAAVIAAPNVLAAKTADPGIRAFPAEMCAKVSVLTRHDITPADETYSLRLHAESLWEIVAGMVSGPGMPDTRLEPDADGGGFTASVVAMPGPLPAVGTEYAFFIRFADGSEVIYQDSIKSWMPKVPAVTVTPGAGTANFAWTNVSDDVPADSHCRVIVSGPGVFWESDELPLTQTTAAFNDNNQVEGTLLSGRTYIAEILMFNPGGDDSCQQIEFTMP
jgi:autotransporter-associated beta strand protein